jgi:hypothetical protein
VITLTSKELLRSLVKDSNYNSLIPSTVDKCQSGTPISIVRKENKKILELAFLKLLSDLCGVYNVSWNDRILVKIIDKIMDKYYFMRIEEISMVITEGMDGIRTPGGKNLQPAHVLEWLHDYDVEDRNNYYISKNMAHKETFDKQFILMEKKERDENINMLKDQIKKQEVYQTAKDVVNDRMSKNKKL